MPDVRSPESLRERIAEIGRDAGVAAVAAAAYDSATGEDFAFEGDRWFHAASTIKLPVLIGVFAAIHRGELRPYSRIHVRNLFHSVVGQVPFQIQSVRDANSDVHQKIGKTMLVRDLARQMIVTSSNLATNLLLDYLGVDGVRTALDELGLSEGIDLRRGVEDDRAHEQGIDNRVTANGLMRLLRALAEERLFTPELSKQMLEILLAQEFNGGIPSALPKEARVAHKTGEISTIAHDAAVVYLPDRRPYVVVVLTEWGPDGAKRQAAIADVSFAVYEYVLGLHDV